MKQILILGFSLLSLLPIYASAQQLSQEEEINLIPAPAPSPVELLAARTSKRDRSPEPSNIEPFSSMLSLLGQSTGLDSVSQTEAQNPLLPPYPDEITLNGTYIYYIRPNTLPAVISAIIQSGHRYKDFRKLQPTAENK